MRSTSTDLVLLLRGVADYPQELLGGRTPLEYAELPYLRRLSRRGQRHSLQAAPASHSVHEGGDLFAAMGVRIQPDQDLPMAAVSWQQTGQPLRGPAAIHADPVRLAVSPEATFVMDPDELNLNRDEAEELVRTLNQELLGRIGASLAVLESACWVLHLPQEPKLRTVPLEGWIGADPSRGLPQGEGRGDWHRLANEIQMVLADHPVNRVRRREGRPEVNCLWLWGGGGLPDLEPPVYWQAVWGQAHGLAGLAHLGGIPYKGPVGEFAQVVAAAEHNPPILVVADAPRAAGARGDLKAKVEALETLDKEWLGDLETALASRALAKVWIALGPEAPTGARARKPVPPCPALVCRSGRVWLWDRPETLSERNRAGAAMGWSELVG